MIWDNSVARGVVFFLVPVLVATGLSAVFESDAQQGLLVGVAVGLVFGLYGVFVVS